MYRVILKTYLKPLFYIKLHIYLLSFFMLVSVIEKQMPPESACSWFSWYVKLKQYVIAFQTFQNKFKFTKGLY